jgi:UDP-N-acetylglucosamine acyltransferase
LIHPSAIVDPKAQIGMDVHIGPYCIVGPHVILGDHVHLHNHVVVEGHTTIGTFTNVYSFACLGAAPQNQNMYDEGSTLTIGAHNIIREYASIQPGIKAPKGQLETRIGDHNLIMSHTVISHDCIIGNHCIFASQVGLAGHVTVDDHAIVGGLAGVHQWVRIGSYAMIGGLSGIVKDVLPYAMVYGAREATCHGPNIVGLKRNSFTNDQIRAISTAYQSLQDQGVPMVQKIESLRNAPTDQTILRLLNFIDTPSKRGLTDWQIEKL